MKRVSIRGDGIAACCCEHLLAKAGFEVVRERSERSRLPAIMLSAAAVELLRDVFDRRDLFGRAHGIGKRVVAWGTAAEPAALDHSAVVVSEQELLDAVRIETPAHRGNDTADWTVITSRPLPPRAVEQSFGARMARAYPVTLRGDSRTCWIESLDEGWLFLIPNRESGAWLLSVGNPSEEPLAHSRVIAGQIAELHPALGYFPASPRIVSPLCGAGWVGCGTAAVAFDPLCGDGTANAVREAILASALIGAIAKGGDPEDLTRHYEARLTAGFARHLSLCSGFYQTGGSGEWWRREADSLQRGLREFAQKSREFGGYKYQLRGFELVPVLR